MESSHFGPIASNTTSIYGALPIHNTQGVPSNRRSSMLSYASVKASNIHSTLGGRCSNANTLQNQLPASKIFNNQKQNNIQQQQQQNKNIRSISPSSIHSPSTTNTSSSGGNGGRENNNNNNNIDVYQQQQQPLQTFSHQSPTHQSLQQQQQSSSLASSSMRSSTLGTPAPSEEDTGASTPRPSIEFGITQKYQQADNEQHIIYHQNQSSPGVPLQNYLTKTIIAGGPEKIESSSFF